MTDALEDHEGIVSIGGRTITNLTAELQKRIQAVEMRCYRKILHVLYKDHVINEEVCAKIQQACVRHEDLTIVKRRKLKWCRHVSRCEAQ